MNSRANRPQNGQVPDPEARTMNRAVTRRDFLKLGGLLAATLGLTHSQFKVFAGALAAGERLPVVWLEFQDCTGETESFLRASPRPDPLQSGVTDPGLTDLLLDVISVEYHETLMSSAGAAADQSLADVLNKYDGQFLCIVEGSIPTAENGIYCTIGGKTALSIARHVLPKARATIALGSCAWDGGLAAAAPNPTGASGVGQAVPGLQSFIALPGCPANVVNLVAAIAYFKAFGRFPETDSLKRPKFAYGKKVHDRCEREDLDDGDQVVLAWGDERHRRGGCLKRMGCKGPRTHSNCPTVRWNDGTCWPVAAGHGCIGCTEPHFWDTMGPFYSSSGNDDDDD